MGNSVGVRPHPQTLIRLHSNSANRESRVVGIKGIKYKRGYGAPKKLAKRKIHMFATRESPITVIPTVETLSVEIKG